MKCFETTKDISKMKSLLAEMSEAGIQPNRTTYSVLLETLRAVGNYQEAQQVFQR
jgi:pentatricopeptide repeat protein